MLDKSITATLDVSKSKQMAHSVDSAIVTKVDLIESCSQFD